VEADAHNKSNERPLSLSKTGDMVSTSTI